MQGNYFIAAAIIIVVLGLTTIIYPAAGASILVVTVLSALAIPLFRHFTEEKDFVTGVFLTALFVRLLFGIFVHIYELRDFFGGDANTYNHVGLRLMENWWGIEGVYDYSIERATVERGAGYGMYYLVGIIYSIVGYNILAAQSFCAVIGAATAPMVYYCSVKIFQNKSVGKIAAVGVALFPAFIIWSSQLLKDGLIIFLLVLTITMVMSLQEKFNYTALIILIFSLGGIISLRFYIFYMVAMAVAGSFIIGISKSTQSIVTRSAILVVMGVGLTYLGVLRNAESEITTYTDLERIQLSRTNLSESKSGFGEDIDVSTAGGAITAIPVGLIYLMLAPFPWEADNLRQAITIPEILMWWAMIPLIFVGGWYAVKHRLRSSFPILFFTLTLLLAYSIFQGNVGTAYRHRTQIQVFLFIFIAVGWTLFRERAEDKKLIGLQKRRDFERSLKAGSVTR